MNRLFNFIFGLLQKQLSLLKTSKLTSALLMSFAINTYCFAGAEKDGKALTPNADPITVKGTPVNSNKEDGNGSCRTTLYCKGLTVTCAVFAPCPQSVATAVAANDYSVIAKELLVTTGSGFEFAILSNLTTISKFFTLAKAKSGIDVWTIFSSLPY